MSDSLLYLGDTHLQSAAAYLAGLLHAWNWPFDYIPSDQVVHEALVEQDRPLYILSDYPAAHFPVSLQEQVVRQVGKGSGLLMIGGWESFHGLGGNWDGTPLGDILPVVISPTDDRVNCDHPLLIARVHPHPSIEGLPWETRPPVIGGYNRVEAKPDTLVLLEARHFTARFQQNRFDFEPAGVDPLLVWGNYGEGNVVALMTDIAPHWVGPLIDWGDERVTAQAPGANDVEVGSLYNRFLRQLLSAVRNQAGGFCQHNRRSPS